MASPTILYIGCRDMKFKAREGRDAPGLRAAAWALGVGGVVVRVLFQNRTQTGADYKRVRLRRVPTAVETTTAVS